MDLELLGVYNLLQQHDKFHLYFLYPFKIDHNNQKNFKAIIENLAIY